MAGRVKLVGRGMTAGHTITITPSTSHVEVRVGRDLLASSDRALVLEETGLRPRYYLPRDDVRMDRVTATSFTTTCPFKGDASYWSVAAGDTVHDGVVWSYEQPIPGAADIAGYLCFYDERVDVTVDGTSTRTAA